MRPKLLQLVIDFGFFVGVILLLSAGAFTG